MQNLHNNIPDSAEDLNLGIFMRACLGWVKSDRLLAKGLLMLLVTPAFFGFNLPAETIKVVDLEWTEASQKSLSRTGIQALEMKEITWNHAETEHFIYHFSKKWMAERAAAEAETYYTQIKKDLKIEEDKWEVKGHIFLFETDESWKQFKETTKVDRWSGGVCIGNEFFLHSPPASKPFTGSTLPHEMTHLVVNRFVRGRIPIWLNEGLAEQQSGKHFAGYTKPKGFNFLPRMNVVSAEDYIPLSELIQANDYPAEEAKVGFFYTQSVRMVQFLIEDHPKQNFLEFLQNLADGMKFENAFDKVYGNIYPNMDVFETKFKDVAISKVKLVK